MDNYQFTAPSDQKPKACEDLIGSTYDFSTFPAINPFSDISLKSFPFDLYRYCVYGLELSLGSRGREFKNSGTKPCIQFSLAFPECV